MSRCVSGSGVPPRASDVAKSFRSEVLERRPSAVERTDSKPAALRSFRNVFGVGIDGNAASVDFLTNGARSFTTSG
jgi:hypothetical protein